MTGYITYFADILLPVPLPHKFTYRVPREFNDLIQRGSRVIVPFGSRKVVTGIVTSVHETPPEGHEAKHILEILDHEKIVNDFQLDLIEWMSEYYLCTQGEVLNVLLPSGFKISSESRIHLHPAYDPSVVPLDMTDHEVEVLEQLKTGRHLTYQEIHEITGLKNIYTLIKSLVRKECIILFEEIKEKYSPKKEKRVRLTNEYTEEANLESLFEKLKNKEKQTDLLLYYLNKVPVYQDKSANTQGVIKKEFQDHGLSPSSLKTLTKNGVFEEFEIIVSRFDNLDQKTEEEPQLTEFQQQTYEEILLDFQKNQPVLLHGITGSGKTEIYIKLIRHALDNGQQVLYLLPEIALTTQIVLRLKKIFGNEIGVYHSKYSDNERIEVWKGVQDGSFPVVIGVRSSIFLPFDNLGLIIVDEEHEHSYKQADPAPRYHARDVSFMLAKMHHSNILLGSATPSIETFYQTLQGKYQRVNLDKRYGDAGLPEIHFADIARERNKKTMKGDFTSTLINSIEKNLASGKQVIVFQNRRGYAPYLRCETCGWIPKCENCDVSLTFHMYKNELRCHYCGYKQKTPHDCQDCGSQQLESKSFGTEKLEEDLKLFFTDCTVKRMDLDTTRSKFGYQTLIEEFEKGDIDILVGTQMISKGLDFDHVGLVGIFDVDRMLHFPDFRANERTFQLVTQVSGRAGRRSDLGEVIIQTYNPNQEVLKQIRGHDYQSFYDNEIIERESFRYPPFYRLIRITFKHQDKITCQQAARNYVVNLRRSLGEQRVLGPEEGIIARIRNSYIYEVLIKLEKSGVAVNKVKKYISSEAFSIKKEKEFKNIQIIFDVDPY